MKSITKGFFLATALGLSVVSPLQAQDLKLDENLTLSPTRTETPSPQISNVFSLINKATFIESTSREGFKPSASPSVSIEPQVSLNLPTSVSIASDESREIKALGFNPKVLSMPLSRDSSLSVSQAKIGDKVSAQTMQGIHVVSKINKDRSIFFGVETFESNADARRANVGILFSLD